ncbi:sensor histidine kinase [Chryseobacterium sp. SC28]|uniref:sensor histidine kinase n=1 Tax=Chryseobacterium sp. SC28 TaxID=2268028 RepID=UPI000F65037C|nr:sensor histidine kinase [Chryseobacterium sp. SC28]RRQ45232.1 hypothetical protein DTW91_11370 [Chryseobacterium sp. SC28]
MSNYIYHCVIWMILIFFKLIMDYSVFGDVMFLMNLQLFAVFMTIFYIFYGLFLPFIVRQNSKRRLAIVIALIMIYVGLLFFFLPSHSPLPSQDFIASNKMSNAIQRNLQFPDILFKVGLFSVIFSTLLFFVDKWLDNQKMIKSLELERQSTELKILREQLNPHFFFNALNSIYSLSLIQSKDTPRVILILSDIMRYVLNDKNQEKNNMNDEIINIKKYIEIQSIRFNKFNNINFHYNGNFQAYKIEPLLLLTFIENAFKYADFQKGSLDILITLKENKLHFYVKNFYEAHLLETTKHNQLGIKNTKMKLDLLYPQKYDLQINDNGSEYEIILNLQLDQNELYNCR